MTKQAVLKVVIVDDSPLVAERLERMVSTLEYASVLGVAGNIGSGFALVSEVIPDVLILDIYLEEDAPRANGLALLSIVKEAFPHIQVIMLTNLSGSQYRSRCLQMGAKYFLDKSNEFDKIPEILLEIFSGRK